MNLLETLWGSPLIHRFGCALLHFLWQGLLIAAILAVLMWILRRRAAGGRYLTAWTALLAMAISVPITAWLASPPVSPPPVTELSSAAPGPPGVELPADSPEVGAGIVGPYRIEETQGPTMAHIPAVSPPAASPAVDAAESADDAPAAANDWPTARASQWIRPMLPWVVCCWILGTLALSVWRLSGWVYLRRLCGLGTSPAPDSAGQMLERLLKRLHIDGAVELLESKLVEVPTVIGWLRPVILLPASILGELPAEQLELILAHELAHIRRHDFLLNLLQTAIETLLFYHPAVWWVSRRIRIEREACCDEVAVAACGDRLLYARALTRLEELRQGPAGVLPAKVGVAADGASLLGRIRRVLGLPGEDQEGRRTWLGGSAAVLLVIGGLVGYVATAGEPRSTPAARASAGPTTRPKEDPAGGSSATSSSPEAKWGQAVEGVQVRLRAAKPRWNEGRTVRLWADLRNQGTRNLLGRVWGPSFEVEVDGQWYRAPLRGLGTIPGLTPFPPGHRRDNIAIDLGRSWELKTSQDARRPRDVQPEQLKLTGGKHTIRVAFTATAAKNTPGGPVRAVSNPVLIEVISAKEIAARPGRLKSQKNAFELRLAYHGPKDNPNQSGVENPIRSLILHTTLVDYDLLHGWSAVAISEEQAARIVDQLQVDGSLVEALPVTDEHPLPVLAGPAYSLTINGPENLVLFRPLGWGLGVLDFLERLRTVLDGGAAEAVDQMMAVLGPQRNEWEAVAKWGQAVEGVQVRLRVKQSRPAAGPQFYADIRNLGKRTPLVYRAANFWTSSELEIDGRWYRRRLPEHGYRPPLADLVPGRQFDNILVYLRGGWQLADSPRRNGEGTGVTESRPGQPNLAPGKHTFRVAVTMPVSGDRRGDYVRVISNPVEIEILVDESAIDSEKTPWGDAVEGVQCRLRAEKPTWPAGQWPTFRGDLRNQGQRKLYRSAWPQSWEIELDGVWYGATVLNTGIVGKWSLSPGEEQTNILVPLQKPLKWQSKGGKQPLEFSPGKHTVRFAVRLSAADGGRSLLSVVSNPVEIEILANSDEPAADTARHPAGGGASSDRRAELVERFENATYSWQQLEFAQQIVKLGDRSVIPKLLPHLDSQDEHLRCNAGFVLAGLGDKRGLDAIISELKTKKARLSDFPKSDTGRPFLEQRYGYYAIHVLGKLRDKRALPVLIEFLEKEPKYHDIEWALGEIGDKRAIPALKRVLEHEDPHRHLWAGCALAKLADPVGIPTVAEFLKDPQWIYRRHAVEGLGASGDTRAVPYLIEALSDQSPDVRVSACKALAKLGDARALPHLEKLLDDRTVTKTSGPTIVRDDAREAIQSIRSKQAEWGPAVEGVQVRLRTDKHVWRKGEDPTFKVDIRNKGVRQMKTSLIASLAVEVDGEVFAPRAWYRLGLIRVRPFGPGAQYTIDLPLSEFGSRDKRAEDLTPGKHTVQAVLLDNRVGESGIYTSLDKYKEMTLAVSNPVEIEIVPGEPAVEAEKTAWGPAVEGVQVRLRADKATWDAGEKPTFKADIRNRGVLDLLVRAADEFCQLQFDGEWYGWSGPWGISRVEPSPLGPGSQIGNISISLEKNWVGKKRLTLTAGKHIVRVAFVTERKDRGKGQLVRAVSNPVEIEIVAENDEKVGATPERNTDLTTGQRDVEARGAQPDDGTTRVPPVSGGELDGKEILKKLKSSDAVYEAGFTASGSRPGWPIKRKWKLTTLHGEIVYQEEVVETAEPAEDKGRMGRSIPPEIRDRDGYRRAEYRIGESIAFRRTFYVGPKVQAEHDWVGRIQRYGPLDPWPEDSPGPATGGVLRVVKPDAPTYMLVIRQPLLCLGRGYSKYVTEIKDASRQANGRLKVTGEGIDIGYRPGAKWELVIEPDAEYMVRSARLVDNRQRHSSFANSGLRRHGSHCVPEKGECKGSFFRASFEFQSASFEADTEFLKQAKETMRPPYLVPTDVSDQRVTPRLHIRYDAGKVSPTGRIKDWDIGLEDPKQPATQWGEALEGVQCRLRAEKIIWQSGEWPKFRADLRNHGERKLYRSGWPESWEIELDGVWYGATVVNTGSVGKWSLFPGEEQTDILVPLQRPLKWRSKEGKQPLEFRPGKHTVRFAVRLSAADGGRSLPSVVSNPVEIEILAKDDEKDGATPEGTADLTSAEPAVGAGGADPDDRTTPMPPVSDTPKADLPPADTSGSGKPPRPRFAGEGLVVDDVTGKPVEQIAVQQGVPNPGAESGIMWITVLQSARGIRGGRFNITHGWVRGGKVRIRVVADGYLPEVAVVDTEHGLVKGPLVIRLRRGEAIRGRVIDHAGKPVAGAKVFLGGRHRHAEIVDGRTERFGGTRETTDADGSFVIHGAARGELSQIVVLAPSLHVWTVRVPVPEPGKEVTIRLPEPATLVIRYDIVGDNPTGRFRLQLKTWDIPDWKGVVSSVQNPTAKNQGEVILKNMTPGVYDVIRMKQLRLADRGTEAFCDRRDVTLEPGKTTTLQFVRKKAFPIEGDVVGLEGAGIPGAFIFVRSPKATGDPESKEDWKLPIYDGASCGTDGKFKTAPIEPGEYKIVAEAYEPEPRGMGVDLVGTGWTLPAYVGKAKVTVPEDGPPPRVRIEMKPRAAGPKTPPTKAPAKGSAEATGETPPASPAIGGKPGPNAASWGPASPKGIRLGVVLEPAKAAYKLGDVVHVKLVLQNTGQREQSLAVPRIGILEKFGMEIDLRDLQGRRVPWDWGGRYRPEVKGLVSGAFAGRIPPGESWELAKAALLLGGSEAASDVVAKLGVEPGQTLRLKLKLDTYSYARDDEAGPLESNTVEFRVEAAGQTASTNRVIDAQGRPVPGAKVEFCANAAPDDRRPFASTVTNQAGEFSYPADAPEKMRFRFYVFVSAPGFCTEEWVGNREVYRRKDGLRVPDTLRLDRPVTVSGKVLGPDGTPLAGVPLAVDYFNERRTWANPRRIVSDEQGGFKIDDLPPGDIFIRYEKGQDDASTRAGEAQLFISHVQAKDGEQAENVMVDLSKAKCALEGQVVDHEGKGIAGASVKATFAASASRLVHYAWARTDEEGRYRIGGLPPHEFLVSVWTKDHYGGPGERVKLGAGETKTMRLLGYLPGHPAPQPKPDDPRWGRPAGDLRAAIELRPSRETYSMGETVEVRPILRNTGEKTVTLVHDFALAVDLRVTDEAGKTQTFSYKNFSGVTVSTTYVLQPGHEVEMQGRFGLKLVGADSAERLIQAPGKPLAFALKCRPGAKYKLSCDLGGGLRTGEARLVVRE